MAVCMRQLENRAPFFHQEVSERNTASWHGQRLVFAPAVYMSKCYSRETATLSLLCYFCFVCHKKMVEVVAAAAASSSSPSREKNKNKKLRRLFYTSTTRVARLCLRPKKMLNLKKTRRANIVKRLPSACSSTSVIMLRVCRAVTDVAVRARFPLQQLPGVPHGEF